MNKLQFYSSVFLALASLATLLALATYGAQILAVIGGAK